MKKISLKNVLSEDKETGSAELKNLRDAMIEDCYFLLVDHGIDHAVIDSAYDQSKLFHSMSEDDPKKQLSHYRNSESSRGWSPCGEEPAYSAGTKATCSAFDMCYEIEEIDKEYWNYGPNLWPPKMPLFRQAVYDYFLEFSKVEKKLVTAIERTLGIKNEYIKSKMTDRSPSTMRMIYYPAVDGIPEDNLFGISAHTDYEVFTLLTQSEHGAQLQSRSGDWRNADCSRYEIIVMLGDMLEVLTNGLIKATPHRVPPVSWERYSITRFCAIDGHHIVEPLNIFTEDKGPLYEPISQQKNIKDGLAQASANTKAMEINQ
ncbi:MAG: 2OG-Fe(II) oxygenase family protein [Gammaproteobacteria bacterium]|nr:2OG-Fe(II) oxygenase family protein [Gammaproteobacteria bacterium]